MKIFDYRYRWYTWLSNYNQFVRLCILLFPTLFLVFCWYFFCYNPMQKNIHAAITQLQKSSKEQTVFHELSNQVLELEKELHLFMQGSMNIVSCDFVYEKIVDSFNDIGISILEFQQDPVRVGVQRQIPIRMKLTGPSDALIKVFYALKIQALFFIVKSCEIVILKNENNWVMNLQGELFYID